MHEPEVADALRARIADCRHCADRFAATETEHAPRPVFRGAASARILIAGQAPGARVHASGLPFDDPSGERLRAWMGVDRETFYDAERIAMLPMAFCFPGYDAKGSDLPPPPDCARLWRPAALGLFAQVRLTLCIGQYAQRWHLMPPRNQGVTETVRAWRAYGPSLVPLPHPSWRNTAWLKRNPWFEAEIIPWLQGAIARELDR
ncbi:MAG: uracil-DNA glycosylase family protein [Pseudomonadota bacterium]